MKGDNLKIKTIILSLLMVGILLLSGCISDKDDDKTDNNSIDSNWLENYKPVH